MKKTFTINISGIVFNIDEDAYEKLGSYLRKIKKHFQGSEGGEEIINDIESRIAEILQDKMSDKKQVVTIDDIDEIIEIMGQPDEFTEESSEEDKAEDETFEAPRYKRLYRDVDSRMLGGVCAGIAAYLKTDPVWIRLIFVVLTLFSGIGILIYLIMWIVVPEARTTAEKLEMKGRRVNISNIEKSIQDEVDHLKDKINDLTDEAKNTFKKKSKDVNAPRDPVPGLITSFFRIVGRLILILAGLIFFLLGISFLVILISSILGGGTFFVFEDIYVTPFPETGIFNILVETTSNIPVIKTTLALVTGIPIIMLIILSLTWIFGLKRNRTIGIVALNIWVISLIVLLVFVFNFARDFRFEGDHTRESIINTIPEKTLKINSNESAIDYSDYSLIKSRDWIVTDNGYEFEAFGKPDLTFHLSDDKSCRLVLLTRARGKTYFEAKSRARKIIYNYSFNDTTLLLDHHFRLAENEVWRDQELNLKLYLPQGQKISIGQNMSDILSIKNEYSRHYMEGRDFIMTKNGLELYEKGLSATEKSNDIHAINKAGFFQVFSGLVFNNYSLLPVR